MQGSPEEFVNETATVRTFPIPRAESARGVPCQKVLRLQQGTHSLVRLFFSFHHLISVYYISRTLHATNDEALGGAWRLQAQHDADAVQ